MIPGSTHRKSDHPIDRLFLDRWSPRAFSGEPITEEELSVLFEAARWAPSSGNQQPWRILYARRDTPAWPVFFNLLVGANQVWAKNAAVLLVLLSKKTDEDGDPSVTHSFDTGAAWAHLALQATLRGIATHGMAGFDYERARRELNVPETFAVEAMVAVGRPGNPDDLPPKLKEREKPNSRRPLSETIAEGGFSFPGS